MAGFMGISSFLGGGLEYKTTKARYRKAIFSLEVADTFRKLSVGLMKHGRIPKNGGMLLVFRKEGRHGIWMMNMKFAIDILWLDKRNRIVHIVEDAEPCRSIFSCEVYKPGKNAACVIELSAGSARRYRMKTGDRISFNA